ncbi:MAG: sensor histidine kinase [Chloroflexi bacterium]|nr:sensor histidine kinase [Chloroflexota bacterium]
MSTFAAIALAIAPAAGGTQLEWALAIQVPALIVLSFTFFDFVYQIVGEQNADGRAAALLRKILAPLTILTLIGYLISATVSSTFYELVRPVWTATLAGSMLASVFVLLAAVLKTSEGKDTERLRVPLLGMLLGVTPFPLATLVPLAIGNDPLAPHLMVLPVILMPSAFAYAILHDQLWGIRRLVHRGLVYALLSGVVLTISVGGVALAQSVVEGADSVSSGSLLAISLVVVVGIVVYAPLRSAVRWLVDRIVYGFTPSYPDFVRGLQRDLASADPEFELPDTLTHVLAEHLDLESALLLTFDEEGGMTAISSVGDGVGRVRVALDEKRIVLPGPDGAERPALLPFEGDQILCMQLSAAGQHVGTILLGPKVGGELFIDDEINLVGNAAPFMAAALERHGVSETMRQLNRRLVETDENSRQRMANDLHDGPLQKAVALAIGRVVNPEEQRLVATELVNELRELGSRLRPSILDDLGLPASIDWLLEHNMRGTDIRGTLNLEGLDEDQRLEADVELTLFRVTQEAINNAVKHSKASEIRISIERDEEQITLTIKDDGVGIGGSKSDPISSSRLGMVGMRERLLQVGGNLEVVSRPDRGVLIQATVPNKPSEN